MHNNNKTPGLKASSTLHAARAPKVVKQAVPKDRDGAHRLEGRLDGMAAHEALREAHKVIGG